MRNFVKICCILLFLMLCLYLCLHFYSERAKDEMGDYWNCQQNLKNLATIFFVDFHEYHKSKGIKYKKTDNHWRISEVVKRNQSFKGNAERFLYCPADKKREFPSSYLINPDIDFNNPDLDYDIILLAEREPFHRKMGVRCRVTLGGQISLIKEEALSQGKSLFSKE